MSSRSDYISNNVGPVKSFLRTRPHALRRAPLLSAFLGSSVDDHGSPVICRSVSVRPKHLFDPNFGP
jgi:hypothetical protein